jgi:amino acid transporter
MYAVGVAEVVVDLTSNYGRGDYFTGTEINDVRFISVVIIGILLGISFLGMQAFAKTQGVLFVIQLVAIAAVYIGSFFPNFPDPDEMRRLGFSGYQGWRNADPAYQYDPMRPDAKYDFFTVLAIFFPAATGIMAGANVSGDLQNPSSAIPKGTLLAVFITFCTYGSLMFVVGLACDRCTDLDPNGGKCPPNGIATQDWAYNALQNSSIPVGGLLYNKVIMASLVPVHPFFFFGVFSSSLSSALSSLVSAPRILQSVAKDRVLKFKWLAYLAVGKGADNNPVRALYFTFVLSVAIALIGNLDAIATLITNVFLASYALVNYACFAASRTRAAGWRPTFKYYNTWVSLLGCLLCLFVMALIDWRMTIVTAFLCGAVYLGVEAIEPDVDWGAANDSFKYQTAIHSLSTLSTVQSEHSKLFRAHVLVMSGPPGARPSLVKFGAMFRATEGLLAVGDVVIQPSSGVKSSVVATSGGETTTATTTTTNNVPPPSGKKNKSTGKKSSTATSTTTSASTKPPPKVKEIWDPDTTEEELGGGNNSGEPAGETAAEEGVGDNTMQTAMDSGGEGNEPNANNNNNSNDNIPPFTPEKGGDGNNNNNSTFIVPTTPATTTDTSLHTVHDRLAGDLAKECSELARHRVMMESYLNNRSVWGLKRCVGAQARIVSAPTVFDGFKSLYTLAGVSKLRPTSVLFGFPHKWRNQSQESMGKIAEYEQMIRTAMAYDDMGVMILRDDNRALDIDMRSKSLLQSLFHACRRKSGLNKKESGPTPGTSKKIANTASSEEGENDDMEAGETTASSLLEEHLSEYVSGGTIDVWWLTEDGGFTALMPHILSLGEEFRGKKLRFFTVVDTADENSVEKKAEEAKKRMTETLFRIRVDAKVEAIEAELSAEPDAHAQTEFETMGFGTLADLNEAERVTTIKLLNLTYIMRQHSGPARKNSAKIPPAIVFVSAPTFHTGIQVKLYTAWMDILTNKMPPTVVIRGTNKQVMCLQA